MTQILICTAFSTSPHPAQLSPSCGVEKKTREDGVEHGQDSWAALREKSYGCSREALRATHRDVETVKTRSDKNPDESLYKKDRCRDRLNSATPKEDLSDRQFEDIILQCLPLEYDKIHQTHF